MAGRFTVQTQDGLALYGYRWGHANTSRLPSNLVVISHGLAEHAGRYAETALLLAEQANSEVFAFDQRGHGQSPGKRGYVRHYDQFVSDLDCAINQVQKIYGDQAAKIPLFVLGHSNGGLIAGRWWLRHPERACGLILSNPAIRIRVPISPLVRGLAHILHWLAPGLTLKAPMRPEHLTRDPERQENARDDKLIHQRICAPLYFGMRNAGQELEQRLKDIVAPLLLIIGESDPLIDPQTSIRLFDQIPNPNKTLIRKPGMRHEPLQELGRAQLVQEIATWLRSQQSD